MRYSDADFDALAAPFKSSAEASASSRNSRKRRRVSTVDARPQLREQRTPRSPAGENFLTAYNAVADKPKFVFKMGIEHLTLGTTSINTIDVGTLARRCAHSRQDSAAHRVPPSGGHNLAFRPQPGNPATEQVYKAEEAGEFFPAIGVDPATLAHDSWTLIPLEPIRQTLETQGIEKLKPMSRSILLGYDFVITTPDAKAGVSLY